MYIIYVCDHISTPDGPEFCFFGGAKQTMMTWETDDNERRMHLLHFSYQYVSI
jgi:hypothetical protein